MSKTIATDKDRQIIRQSMSKFSLQYFNSCKICPSLTDIIKTTTMLEDFVINGYSKEMISKFEKLDEFLNSEYRGN